MRTKTAAATATATATIAHAIPNANTIAPLCCAVSLGFGLLGLVACEPEPPPAPTKVERTEAATVLPREPTPEQKKALANALHKAHMEAEKDPTECRDCHRIEGEARPSATHRCLGCHEDQATEVHRKLKNAQGLECLACHNFTAEKVDAWACATCHVKKSLDPKLSQQFSAKLIEIHGDEACSTCHAPHAEPSLKPGKCLECHEKQSSRHHEKALKDPEQCLECHKSHEPAASVLKPTNQCRTCHADDAPRRVLFKGHDDCTTCHRPHDNTIARDCRSCHKDKVVADEPIEDHRACLNCHKPHARRSVARKTCVGCHQKTLVAHPADDAKGTCVGCHSMHKDGAVHRTVGVEACHMCHEKATTDASFHGGALCANCHKPHDFDLKGRAQDASFCRTCHLEGAPHARGKDVHAAKSSSDAKAIRVVHGHDACEKCHVQTAHTPTEGLAACGSCHDAEQASLVKGHEKCLECHEPHRGSVKQTCLECHTDRKKGVHANEVADCQTCHRPHGPGGTATPLACVSCHDRPLPLLHQIEKHRECTTCHVFHGDRPKIARATCLESCHKDLSLHEPKAKTCTGCHPFGGGQP
ncbi:MAG: hypothetical protein H6729_04680 [Deltaproteobacteria bacterium]|nr:hypothetical protein [Deltaproteobacteria bacterium]